MEPLPIPADSTLAHEAEPEKLEIVYQGPDVEDGTMGVRELSEVFDGLNRAFSIVASESDTDNKYQLRVKDVKANSFHIILEAVQFAKSNPAAASAVAAGAAVGLNAVTNAVSGAYRVIVDIAKMMDAKKRAKGIRIGLLPTSFEDGVVKLTVDSDLIILTKEQYELLLSQRVDKPLSQIVSPLESKKLTPLKCDVRMWS